MNTTTMNANVASDRDLARRLLDQFDLDFGDLVYIEETTRRERRGFVGQVLFARTTSTGAVVITYTGRSGWAPGSGSAYVLPPTHFEHGNLMIRKLDADDRRLFSGRGHWSHTENTPLNWRIAR